MITLYELRATELGEPEWDWPYDKMRGFIIAAESEEEARSIAHANCGDEGSVWLEPTMTYCKLLTASKPGVVMSDFHAG